LREREGRHVCGKRQLLHCAEAEAEAPTKVPPVRLQAM